MPPLTVTEPADISNALDVAGRLSQLGAAALITIVLLCLVFRKFLVPEWYAKELETKVEHAEKETSDARDDLAELQKLFRTEVIPALTQAAAAQAAYNQEAERRRWSAGGSGNAP